MKKLRSARGGYAVSLLAAMTVAAMFGGLTAYGTAAALLVLAGAAALLTLWNRRQLSVRHALNNHQCTRGSEVRYAVLMRNRGIVPLTWAEASLSSSRGGGLAKAQFEVSLTPFGEYRYQTGFCPPHRGIYTLLIDKILVSDPFRLTHFKCRRPDPLTLMALPKLTPIMETWKQRLDPQGSGGFFAQTSDEPAVDNRTYRYGDSPRRIHWNLTARKRELMVRQYESIESRRLLIVLDLSPHQNDPPEASEDTLIEACLSVVQYALEKQIITTLVYAEGDTIQTFTGRDMRIFDEIHYAMATMGFTSNVPALHLIDEARDAQMVYLFSMTAPGGETLSGLPQDKPVELAFVRGGKNASELPDTMGAMHVTELVP